MKELAKSLQVTTRTLRTWKSYYLAGKFPKVGRPPHSVKKKLETAKKVKSSWHEQGRPGWRAIKASIPECSTVLVQKFVSILKRKERQKQWAFQRKSQKRIKVLYPNVVWSQDATFLGEKSSKRYAEIVKDRCSLRLVEAEASGSLSNFKTLEILDRNVLPLVYMSDNGSAYTSKEVSNVLREKRVIHLKSLPRTPQNNGAAEVAVREVKRLYSFADEEKISDQEKLKRSKEILNTKRLWASLDYRTVEEYEETCARVKTEEIREELYAEYELGVLRIERNVSNGRKRRVLEREFILGLLEKYGLIKRYEGSVCCG